MKHMEDLRKALAVNKRTGDLYEVTVDKYSDGYKVVKGIENLVGRKTKLHGHLTSHYMLVKVFNK